MGGSVAATHKTYGRSSTAMATQAGQQRRSLLVFPARSRPVRPNLMRPASGGLRGPIPPTSRQQTIKKA
jgi:hypothetical protein